MVRWNLREVLYQRRILSVSDFKRRLMQEGISISYSCAYLLARGNPKRVSLKHIEAICAAVDCSPGDIIQLVETGTPSVPGQHRRHDI